MKQENFETMNERKFRILTIDGGGIRGVFPAHILRCISERLKIDIKHYFDMISGTSTGAIIAAAVACNIGPERIVSMYQNSSQKIFQKKKTFLPNLLSSVLQSRYRNEYLANILKEVFGELKLGDIETPLLLPATDIGHGGVHVFKSKYSPEFTRDGNVPVWEAVLASCSAPTYFDPKKVDQYLLCDGGLWANNPSLAAVIDAMYRLNIKIESIRILSLGTGTAKTSYGVDTNRKWGFLRGWRGAEFINFLMSLQGQSTQNYLQLLLSKEQLLRLDFESDLPLPLDNVEEVDNLISRADRIFTHNSSTIKKFMN